MKMVKKIPLPFPSFNFFFPFLFYFFLAFLFVIIFKTTSRISGVTSISRMVGTVLRNNILSS